MELIEKTLGNVRIGREVAFQNLTMFPLLDGKEGDADYLTLDEALGQSRARITEVSTGGSVPQLNLENSGDSAVLLMDGEELVGAKQNRILNLTILAAAHTTLVIPVSCVEQGRWSRVSAEFDSSARAHYAAGRLRKMAAVSAAMHSSGERVSDQGEVWADISAKARRMAADSPTGAMSAMYERHLSGLEDFVRALAPVDGQAGALFTIDGAHVGFDLFDYPATFRKLLPKLVRSYALDAIDAAGSEARENGSAEEMLRAVGAAKAKAFPALGEGEDVRISGPHLTGGALVARGRVVHLSAFRLVDASGRRRVTATESLSRPSTRSRQRQRG